MKKAINKFLSVFLALVLTLSLIPALELPAKATDDTSLSLTLGDATVTDGTYYYKSATVTGSGIKTILLSFSGSVADGDKIILPETLPSGFMVSPTSESNDYTKRINIDSGADASTVQSYIQGIGFTLAGSSQSVKVTITTEDVQYDTFYDVDTQHYYQYVPYALSSKNTAWTDAYTAAESMTYMGRTGYLATVTSLGEDTFINSLSGNKVGWLGGTALIHSDEKDGDMYYQRFTGDTSTSAGGSNWYWACGPECGDVFYNGRTPDRTNCGNGSGDDADNPYWNWANEPSGGGETCLTTLFLSGSVHSTAFSWNDITYNYFSYGGTYSPAGYFVEYGNLTTGSNEAIDTRFASVTGSLSSTSYSASISGNTMSGQTLTAALSGESDGDALTYQWLRDDAEISDATSQTYTLTDSDVGHMIAVKITDSGTMVTSPCVGPVTARPTITATADDTNNCVDLHWTSGGDHYMVYQKDSGETIYQSIPVSTDIKVLNVYPDISGSDSLQGWMTTYGSPTVNGISYNMMVDKVSLSDFNGTDTTKNYSHYLAKNTDGSYKYDVLYFGAWDANNGLDLSNDALAAIKAFVNYGGGCLLGHDTADVSDKTNFVVLAQSYLNMICSTNVGLYGDKDGNSTIEVLKNGLLTNYPYKLTGELTIPACHTTNQFAMGDVWMNFVTNERGGTQHTSFNGSSGTNNFYLTTWNNAAMIQTGHSEGTATEAEQKILTNTLYYLAQVTKEDSATDHMAQDLTPPDPVNSNTVTAATDGNTTLNWIAPSDNGNTYDYYVREFSSSDGSSYSDSDTASATVTTGVAGYYVLVDTTATETTDTVKATGKYVTTNSYSPASDLIAGQHYAHIMAVDGAGNESTVTDVPFTLTADTATVNVNLDSAASNTPVTGKVELKQSGTTRATLSSTDTGVYTASVVNGTYDVFVNDEDTGKTIKIDGAAASTTVNYYTVTFSALSAGAADSSTVTATAGGTGISTGAAVLEGETVVFTATGAGAGTDATASSYTYAWSGEGTSDAADKTKDTLIISPLSGAVAAACTVTGSATYPVTLDTNGGAINSGTVASYVYGTGAALPANVTKTDYVFGGWYANPDFSDSTVTAISKTDKGAKTFYAKWMPQLPVAGSGSALTFDGTNDYVDLGQGVTLGKTFTEEVWVCPTAANDWTGIMGNEIGGSSRNSTRAPCIYSFNGGRDIQAGFGDGSHWDSLCSSDVLTPSAWNHIAFVYDGNTIDLYVNGILKGQLNCTAMPYSTPIKYFGRMNNFDPNDYFSGQLDEVKIWNTARTQAQIRSDMYSHPASDETGLVGYWNFDKGSDSTAENSVGSVSNGTLTNMDTSSCWTDSGAWQNRTTAQDTPLVIDAGYSMDGGSVTLGQITAPLNGKLSFNNIDKTVTYTPNAGYSGPDTFTYSVTNNAGTDNYTVNMTVVPNPVMTGPESKTTAAGASASFAVAVTVPASGTISYQWQKKDSGGNWADIANATAATYTMNSVAAGDAGDYRCVVTNTDGTTTTTTTSGEAALTVTFTAAVNVNLDGAASGVPVRTGVVLKQGSDTKATLSSSAAGVYTSNVINGTYDVYVNDEDTGTDITVSDKVASVAVDYYTVSFSALNAPDSSAIVQSGGMAAMPGGPARTGYLFNGWYKEETCKSVFDFTTAITEPVSLYAGWKADAPSSAPEISGKTDATITVKAVAGQEYSIDGINWQSSGVFSDLAANTAYTVYSRVAASGNDFASDPSHALTVTTKASVAAAPSAPTVTQQTSDSITIGTVAGQQYAVTTSNSEPTTWNGVEAASGTKTFSGLDPATEYYIWTRMAETDTAMPSGSSSIAVYTAKSAPSAGDGYSINYGTETISITSGYEVSASGNFSSTLSDGAAVTPGTTYYVRKAADTNGSPASAWTEVALPERPGAPSVSETDETIDGKNDGKITGVSDSMEYKLSSDAVWTPVSSGQASGGIEDLPDGDYNIRYKAVQPGTFASSVQTITIAAGRKISVTFDSCGGSDVESATGLSYGGHVTEPANPTKSGYYFAGWYKEPACSNIWTFAIDTLSDNLTLHAKWDIIPTYTVTGSVVDDADNPQIVQGATVKIMQGVLQFGTTAVTDQYGNFSIEDVPAGIYDLIVTKDTRTAVIKISVSSGNIAVGNIVLPSSNADSSLVVQGNDTPNVVVGGLNTEALTQLESGSGSPSRVKLILTVEKKDEKEAANGTNVTEAARDAGLTTGMILDVDLSKSVNGGTPAALSESTDLIEIIIPIPKALQNKFTYSIFRYHGTSVDNITQTPNSDHERIKVDRNNWTITLYAKKFSTYSIAYQDYNNTSSGGTTSAGDGGTITLKSGSAYGGSRTYVITPDDGYYISDVIVDGKSVGPVSSYTFSDTKQEHTIQAVFKKISGLPYYTDENGNKVFIGFASDKSGTMKYIAPKDKAVLFTPNPKNFTDISGQWAQSYIDFVTQREIFVGTGGNLFSPDAGMTRAMFAAVIGRLYERSYGPLTDSSEHAFTDVNYDDYYGRYVDWASQNKVIIGVGGGLFKPDREITREEMAAILYRFATFLGVSAKDYSNDQLAYPDNSSISSWAMDAAKYCQQTGIIVGRDNGNFAPQGTATRAEVSAILERFIERMV